MKLYCNNCSELLDLSVKDTVYNTGDYVQRYTKCHKCNMINIIVYGSPAVVQHYDEGEPAKIFKPKAQ